MTTLLKNATLWNSDHSFSFGVDVLIYDGIIADIGKDINADADKIIDVTGNYLIPGFVDVHTHGRVGYDFNTADKEQMLTMKRSYIENGVTSVFPTLASDTIDGWKKSLKNISACGFDGIHLEGRYLSEKRRGAHAAHLLASPDFDEVEDAISTIDAPVHISIAPEIPGGYEFIKRAVEEGMTVGIAHTSATANEARKAIFLGAKSFTHLFNGMNPMHHREGGAVCAALTSGAYCELIVDGLHICSDMVNLAYSCVGKDRFVLITDSMAGAGCADGKYSIAGQDVQVTDGCALTPDGALAGSTLDMLTAIKNLMKFTGATLGDAVACATKNPAEMVGIYNKIGSVEVGKIANMVVLDKELCIKSVIYTGKLYN